MPTVDLLDPPNPTRQKAPTRRSFPFGSEGVRALLHSPEARLITPLAPQPATPVDSELLATRTRNPYGRAGDALWVQEAWQAIHVFFDHSTGLPVNMTYAPGGPPTTSRDGYWTPFYQASDQRALRHPTDRGYPWRPASTMPEWASRLRLRIGNARLERLRSSAKEPGTNDRIMLIDSPTPFSPSSTWGDLVTTGNEVPRPSSPRAFKRAWNERYAHQGMPWRKNPWVWIVDVSIETTGVRANPMRGASQAA